MFAGNYFGKIADKIEYKVIEWPSTRDPFYVTLTISGDQTKFAKYELYDKTTSQQYILFIYLLLIELLMKIFHLEHITSCIKQNLHYLK